MPWRCPACSLPIQQRTEAEAAPRPGVIYRCHVCRLELVLDPNTNKLVLAPLGEETAVVREEGNG